MTNNLIPYMVFIDFIFFQAQHYYLIQDLITWKDYVLQVASYNNKGVGVYSDSIRIKTKEGGKIYFYFIVFIYLY